VGWTGAHPAGGGGPGPTPPCIPLSSAPESNGSGPSAIPRPLPRRDSISPHSNRRRARQPVETCYGRNERFGEGRAGADSPDDAVFLPRRNVLLLASRSSGALNRRAGNSRPRWGTNVPRRDARVYDGSPRSSAGRTAERPRAPPVPSLYKWKCSARPGLTLENVSCIAPSAACTEACKQVSGAQARLPDAGWRPDRTIAVRANPPSWAGFAES